MQDDGRLALKYSSQDGSEAMVVGVGLFYQREKTFASLPGKEDEFWEIGGDTSIHYGFNGYSWVRPSRSIR